MMLVSCLLTGDNYPMRQRAIISALKAKNKLVFVDGSMPKPAAGTPEFSAWTKCNVMVIAWIFNSLANEVYNSVAFVDTATEIWKELQCRFSQGNIPRIYELKQDLALLRQDDLTVSAYFTKLKTLWDKLNSLVVYPKCTCGAAKIFSMERDRDSFINF
ncbi:PREDICTED: uncharacterized protein LOC109115649 [Nelumbo nucifera]|uniref:Uncharacterized protein LOC109115649 n=1 Tax=Nelumbo nucifera TaxID=4432 RepID=A0A1U8Q9F2_NELNU|nr:PREDICTED: uncharacterized protein LOC109115649 [Nelumbo nucifera]